MILRLTDGSMAKLDGTPVERDPETGQPLGFPERGALLLSEYEWSEWQKTSSDEHA